MESLVVIEETISEVAETSDIFLEYESLFFFYLNIKVKFEYYAQLTAALTEEWSTILGVSKCIYV